MRQRSIGWGLLSPSLLVLAIMGFLPFFYVAWVGFHEWNTFSVSREMNWVGADNYRKLVFDPLFLGALGRSLAFTFTTVFIQLVLGFLLANTLTRDFPGKAVFRTIYVLPLVVAPIAVGATWRMLAIPGFGPIPYFLDRWFDIDFRIGTYPAHAWLMLLLMDIWHWTPFVTLTMLAGLLGMPKEPMEQAMVDGANKMQVFRYLTIPLMMPVLLTVVFIRFMDALRIVDEAYMLTNGGPGLSTTFIGIHIYRSVIPRQDFGYGSAMSLLTLYFTIVLCWLLFVAMSNVGKQRE
ncbi:MAG: carbohydrate ABC transporter permease [Caldilineaceae bacterium]